MFNFIKELAVVGIVSSALGKIVHKMCGVDFLSKLSTKERNALALNVMSELEKIHSRKFLNADELPVDDAMVVGFLILAKKISPKDALNHQLILMGLMRYLEAAINQNGQISSELLVESRDYITAFKIQ
jgi:hypothetical protein